jgi:HSP20 family protein
MMADMENRFHALLEGFETTPLLPAPEMRGRFAAVVRGEFKVDVQEKDDEVFVEAELPGIEKEDVSIRLCDPRTLEISSERKMEKERKEEGYYIRERSYGMLRRLVRLPTDATDEGASAAFKNGVLEIHLKKMMGQREGKIAIE